MAENFMVHIVFSAEIHKSLNSSIGWNILCSGRIDMDQYVAVMSGQKTGGLDGPHIIIGIDTGDVLIFPFNGDNGNLKICRSREDSVWLRTMSPSIL